MATAALLIAATSAVTLMTTHHLAVQLATTALRLVAVAVLWQTLPRAVHDPRGWLPVAAYVAGLFAPALLTVADEWALTIETA